MSRVLVADFGGTSLRVALAGPDGVLTGLETVGGVASSADPAGWWREFSAACAALKGDDPAGFASVEAVAISAFTRTQIFLDPAGAVIRPALLWGDDRAAAQAAWLRDVAPQNHPEAVHLNAYHPLARLRWLAEHEPDAAARVAAIVEPKDYLNFRLTGRIASDRISMARFAAAGTGSPSLFAAARLDAKCLPELLDPTAIGGTIAAGLPSPFDTLAGRPVVAMANDTWAAVVGLGALRAGYGYNISGTTEVLGVIAREPAHADGLLSVDWGPELRQLGGPGQNGADTLAWLVSLLGGAAAGDRAMGPALDDLLGRPRAVQPLLFLPYLQGERVPHWDADLRGAFVGLDRRHGTEDLAWAVMEGVAFVNRTVLTRAEAGTGATIAELRFGGGGAANARWAQLKADILDRPVVTTRAAEPGLTGAAIVAWYALGRYSSLAAAQSALAAPARRFVPNPAARAHYDRLYGWFREAEQALAPLSRRLATSPADRP